MSEIILNLSIAFVGIVLLAPNESDLVKIVVGIISIIVVRGFIHLMRGE